MDERTFKNDHAHGGGRQDQARLCKRYCRCQERHPLYSFVEAESHEAAAKAFENHPHLQIPQSSIEIMYVRPMGGM